MNILNEFFDKIYCVTVYDFYDRHELVKKQLKGIDFEWMFSPPSDFIKPTNISVGNLSLMVGHMECIWNAKMNGYEKIAIWEDDGTFIASENEIKLFFDNVPDNWDCLYMGNASWNDGIWNVMTVPFNKYVNKVIWGTGSGFNAIQSHAYDRLVKEIVVMDEPIDYKYYKIFGMGNSYSPSKGYFSDPISMPNEHHVHKVKSLERFIPSRIVHYK